MKFELGIKDKNLLGYLRWNSCLSTRFRLLYIATPKVACTSLKWWFADLEGYSKSMFATVASAESSPELAIHDTLHKIAPNVNGLTPEALMEPLQSDEYFRFALVRNPYKRIFSAWQSKLLLREPLQIGPYLDCGFFHSPVTNAGDIAQAFEGFLEHLAAKEMPNFCDVHWTPQAILLRPDLISYSKLVQIENVQELSAALAEHLGPEIPNPFANRFTNESLIPYLPEFVSDRASELVRLLYAQDFDLFGYSTQKPVAKEKFSADQLNVALKAISMIRARHQRLTEIRLNHDELTATLKAHVQELLEGNAWMTSQRDAWQNTASELNAQISSLQAQVKELLTGNAWMASQRDAWKSLASDHSDQIAKLNEANMVLVASLVEKDQKVKDTEIKIAEIFASRSWRFTESLRVFCKRLSKIILLQNKY